MHTAKGFCGSRPILAALLTLLVLPIACAGQTRYYSSVVEYLYPDQKDPIETPTIPTLSLPMKVGIAFVPSVDTIRRRTWWEEMVAQSSTPMPSRPDPVPVLTEKQKLDLMREVSEHFKKSPDVRSIELIPSPYLKPAGSFANLDQIRTMYGIDLIVLLAYDQVHFTDEGVASILYWTVVGAYTVPGEKNSTQTMLDAVVYDIKSRKMLFRAPGLSKVEGHATPVNLSEELRQDSEQGFQETAKDLILRLDQELVAFKEKVKERPEEYKVVRASGSRGAGSLDWLSLALFAVLGGVGWRLRR